MPIGRALVDLGVVFLAGRCDLLGGETPRPDGGTAVTMRPKNLDLGRFRLAEVLGADAVGQVYRAEMIGTLDFARHVVVKVLHPALAEDLDNFAALLEESERVARLQSSKIVNVLEAGRRHGVPYLALEQVDGWHLDQLMERCRTLGRRVPIAACAYIVAELTVALRHMRAHEGGLVHGAIAPSQVFITRSGQVKLGDCCSAHLIARAAGPVGQRPAWLLPYLAPEQAAGAEPGPHTDVYALALVLFELLTGCRLNDARTTAEMLELAASPPELLPSNIVDDAAPLDDAVRAALCKTVKDRSSAEGLGSRLRIYLSRREFDELAMAQFCAAVEHLIGQRALAEVVHGESPSPVSALALRGRSNTPYELAQYVGEMPLDSDSDVAGGRHDHPQVGGSEATPEMEEAETTLGVWRRTDAVPRSSVWPVRAAVTLLALILVGGVALYLARQRRRPTGQVVSTIPRPRGTAAPSSSSSVEPRVVAVAPDEPRAPTRTDRAASAALAQPRNRPTARPPAAEPSVEVHSAQKDNVTQPSTRRAGAVVPLQQPMAPGAAVSTEPKAKAKEASSEDPPSTRLAAGSVISSLRHKEMRQLIAQARARGLLTGDDPRFDRLCREAQARGGRAGEPVSDDALGQLRILVEDFAVDAPFIERKLRRLDRVIAAAGGERAEQLRRAKFNVQQLVKDQAFVEASRLITALITVR